MTDPTSPAGTDSAHSTHPAQLSVKDLLKQRAETAAALEDDFQPLPPPPPPAGLPRTASQSAIPPVPGAASPPIPPTAGFPPPPPSGIVPPREFVDSTAAYSPRRGRGQSAAATQVPPEPLPPPPLARPLAQMSTTAETDDSLLDRVHVPLSILPQNAVLAGLGAAVLVSPVMGLAMFFGRVGFTGYSLKVLLCYAAGWCIGTACNRFGGRGVASGMMGLGSFCLSLMIGKFLGIFIVLAILGGAISEQRARVDEQVRNELETIATFTSSWEEMKSDYSLIQSEADMEDFILAYELGETDVNGNLTEASLESFKERAIPVLDQETGHNLAEIISGAFSERNLSGPMSAFRIFIESITMFDFLFSILGLYVAYREAAAQDGDL